MTWTRKSTQHDAIKGAWIEYGQFTITPAASAVITSDTVLEVAADTNISANTGDQIFVNPVNLSKNLTVQGARVSVNGTVKVFLGNYSGTNITDSSAETFDYLLLHYS